MSMLPKDWAEFRQYEISMLDGGNAPMTYNEWCKATGRLFTRLVHALDRRGYSIITISAYDDDDARVKIDEQLHRNPSRVPYFNEWERAGRPLRWED